MQHQPTIHTHLFSAKRKKLRTAFLLALLLGPVGLFYTDAFGGLAMFAAGLISLLMFPAMALAVIWIICIVWAVGKVKRVHKINAMYAHYYKSVS